MIPKIIHYCWYGRGELPDLAKKCISSWRKYCPDYKIICWDETNSLINECKYAEEAYYNRKFAFVTDYMRLKVLYEYGGIYMDTDVELISPLDDFLAVPAFTGIQDHWSIVTGIIGAEKEHSWIRNLLDYYSTATFYNNDGSLNLTPNTEFITEHMIKQYGWKYSRKILRYDDLVIYPFDYFCAKDWLDGKIHVSKRTVSIHHFSGSWVNTEVYEKKKLRRSISVFLYRILGRKYVRISTFVKSFIRERG